MLPNFEQLLTLETWITWLDQWKALGPIAPIALAMLESIIPPLPLILIVSINASIYGFVWGFLYSYLGVVLGSFGMFLLYRALIKGQLINRFYHGQRFQRGLAWVERQPPLFLFLISAIPFTPSSLVNLAFGLSGYSKRAFFIFMASGKAIAIALMAFFGHSLRNISDQPFGFMLSLILIAVAYLIAQRYHHFNDRS
jgi:uncharacterized membrane protein YdjX (TVP38/TMEM64 family)